MRALILCAGNATRLGNFAGGQPKPLIKLGENSNLIHILRKLERLGVNEVIINTHKQHSKFISVLDQFETKMEIVINKETKLLGTLGTLKRHLNWLASNDFWVIHGDNFFQDDLSNLALELKSTPSEILGIMGTFKSLNYRSVGIVKSDQFGVFTKLYEKSYVPFGRNANAAIYFFRPEIAEIVRRLNFPSGDISRDLLPHLIGKLKVIGLNGYFVDIGTPKKLMNAMKIAQSHTESN